MPVVPHLESIAAMAGQVTTSEHFSFGLRDFLDGFYENPQASKLADEPRLLTDVLNDEGYADAYLAALAEHLAGQYRFPVPSWCSNPERSLKEPKFAFKTPEGRMFLLVESPTAFRVRNIFISADGLTRV
jgi:hypothetical protein